MRESSVASGCVYPLLAGDWISASPISDPTSVSGEALALHSSQAISEMTEDTFLLV